MNADFTFDVQWDDVLSEYEAYCCELPFLFWTDEDRDFAIAGCRLCVADYLADGEVGHDG